MLVFGGEQLVAPINAKGNIYENAEGYGAYDV